MPQSTGTRFLRTSVGVQPALPQAQVRFSSNRHMWFAPSTSSPRASTISGGMGASSGTRRRASSWLAWLSLALSVVLYAAEFGLILATPAGAAPQGLRLNWWLALSPISNLGFALVGALIVTRGGPSRIGWIACAIGLLSSLRGFTQSYAAFGLSGHPGLLPGALWLAWIYAWGWDPPVTLAGVVLPILFPDGRLPSQRWRIAIWLAVAEMVAHFAGAAFLPETLVTLHNPAELPSLAPYLRPLIDWTGVLQLALILAAAVALGLRYRRGRNELRLQVKWLASAVALLGVLAVMEAIIAKAVLKEAGIEVPVLEILVPLSAAGLPLAIGFAIFKYRLYEIDLVISKGLLVGAMAVFVSAVYVGIVVGVGRLIGAGSRLDLLLSILATALVAVAFQPAREAAQQWINRLVYGRQATPYEALVSFSRELSSALSVDEVLPQLAEAAARGVAGSGARVRVFLPGSGERAFTWPEECEASDFDRLLTVTHQGQIVGEIAISKPPGESLSRAEAKLLENIAAQAGPTLHNVRLTAELAERLEQIQAQADELTASRTRIVRAQEAERRRIERNIHDGVQQEFVALIANLRLARNQLNRNPEEASLTLRQAQEEAEVALQDLRELAHGIHPAVLSARGIVEAVEARVARLRIGVRIEAEEAVRSTRYPEEVEGAAYFLVSECLANVLKHADAKSAHVAFSATDSTLCIEVADDGHGLGPRPGHESGLRGLRDRIEALGGKMTISSDATGTRLVATLPARGRAQVHA